MLKKRAKEKIENLRGTFVDAITTYLLTGSVKTPLNKLYFDAYNLVWDLENQDVGDVASKVAYDFFISILTTYSVQQAMPRIKSKHDKELITEFSLQWKNYTLLSFWTIAIFKPIEKYTNSIIEDAENCGATLYQKSLRIFEQNVAIGTMEIVADNLFKQLLEDKEGTSIDWNAVKACVQCFRMNGILRAKIVKRLNGELEWVGERKEQTHIDVFEEKYFNRTSQYFEDESKKWIATKNCPEYCRDANQAIEIEETKWPNFLSQKTCRKLLSEIVKVVVEKHAEEVVNKEHTGARELIAQKRFGEIGHLTQLLGRAPAKLELISEILIEYIQNRGKALEQDKSVIEDPKIYIEKVLELKEEMDSLMVNGFKNRAEILRANDKGFKSFLTDFELAPRFLADYVNYLMCQGLRGKEAEIEHYISNAFMIFKLLNSKDIFINRNQELYGNRLLSGSSISDSAEESLISKIKIELGAQNVARYLQMKSDIDNSVKLIENFRKETHGGVISGIKINVKTLTSGIWKDILKENCLLPEELKTCCQSYEIFYKKLHVGKSITFIASQGECEVSSSIYSKPYIFTLSTFQASIIVLYNLKDTYTYTELLESTKLRAEVMNHQLYNMTNPRMGKLLIKEDLKIPSFKPDEKIRLNLKFEFPNLKVKLICVDKAKRSNEEHVKQNKEEEKQVLKLRATTVQTVIVKIMKGRRKCLHNELITDTIKNITTFKATPNEIKPQIEWLIENDYIIRDEKDRNTYIYKP